MTSPRPLALSRCESCHNRFLPRPGACPRCGGTEIVPVDVEPRAVTLAATQVENPPAGWPSPHRLALVELEESVRVLTAIDGALPAIGQIVIVRFEEGRYRATGEAGSG